MNTGRSLARMFRQFENVINQMGRDMAVREGGRMPIAGATASRLWPTSLPEPLRALESDVWLPEAPVMSSIAMPMDVIESDNDFQVNIDLPPGVAKDQVTLEKNNEEKSIKISAERKQEQEFTDRDNQISVKERVWGNMFRELGVPDNVDMDAITSKFDNGVLRVMLPKKVPTLPATQTIQIE